MLFHPLFKKLLLNASYCYDFPVKLIKRPYYITFSSKVKPYFREKSLTYVLIFFFMVKLLMFIESPFNESDCKRKLQKYLYPPLKKVSGLTLCRGPGTFCFCTSYFTPRRSSASAACLKSRKCTVWIPSFCAPAQFSFRSSINTHSSGSSP